MHLAAVADDGGNTRNIFQLFRISLRRTAGHDDGGLRIPAVQLADHLTGLSVGLLRYGAGVDDIDVAGFFGGDNRKAALAAFFRDGLAFILVDLAAEGQKSHSFFCNHSITLQCHNFTIFSV